MSSTPTQRAMWRARARMKNAWREYHYRTSVKCLRCGLTRNNVVHETDREHAPEGLAYYADVRFCEFLSSRPEMVTTARETAPSNDIADYMEPTP